MKKVGLKWAIFLCIVLIVVLIGYNKYNECIIEKDKELQIAKELKYEKEKKELLINQMASKYLAIVNWQDLFKQEKVYSIDLENTLKPKNGKPILVIALVNDILKKEDKLLSLFNTYLGDWPNKYKLTFSLECNECQIKQILERKLDKGAEYIVVAHIKSVEKEIESKDEDINNTFLINGECIDLIYLRSRLTLRRYLPINPFKELQKE